MKHLFITGTVTCLIWVLPSHATDTYVVGLSGAADSAEGLSVNALVDYSFNQRSSVAADVGVTRADGDLGVIRSTEWELAYSHDFGAVGLTTSIGQWGDRGEYRSNNWSAGLFSERDAWRLSIDYLNRDMELTFRSAQNTELTSSADARSEATALALSFTAKSGKALYLNGTRYTYNRDLTRLNQFRIARLLSPTALTLSGGLLDHSYSVGGDWPVGENVASVTVSRDRTSIDRVDVNSLTLGWLTPIGDLTDLDIGIGVSQDKVDTQYFVSLLFLRYGGVD